MNRRLCWSGLLLLALGCQSAEKAAIQPLPPDAGPMSYQDLVQRATLQVGAAHEYFYRDSWPDVNQAAGSIQETAVLLDKLKAEDVPEKYRTSLAKRSKELSEAAVDLRAASQAKDAVKTTEVFQRLHLTMRELRREQ